MMKKSDRDLIWDALMAGLAYAQDAEAIEKAGLSNGYKKGVASKDVRQLEKAIKLIEA